MDGQNGIDNRQTWMIDRHMHRLDGKILKIENCPKYEQEIDFITIHL